MCKAATAGKKGGIMKKVTLAIAMAALVLFAGCKKDKETTGTTLKASIEQQQSDGSKTSLDPSDGAIKWTAGDKILVNNGTTNGTFTLVGNGGSTNGTFSYNGEYEFGESNVAVYPHTATINGNTITFDLPAEQNLAAPGSFADDANPMMGTFSDPNSLSFTSLCGGLGLQLTGNNIAITAIEIVSNTTTEKLNGQFEVDATPKLVPTAGNSGTNSVRLNCTTTLTTTAQSFFIVLPVGTLTDGFTMNVYGDGADPIFSKTKSGGDLVVMLNTIKTMNSLEVVPSTPGTIVDLSTLDGNYEAQDGDVLTGNLNGNDPNRKFKISIADGATVMLNDVTIDYGSLSSLSSECNFAGITCPGDAIIVLEGSSTVKSGHYFWPCIYIAEGKTLTIRGEGSLNAICSSNGAAIGGGYQNRPCGNIIIEGGDITATKQGAPGAAIGAGYDHAPCGDITINGGTINATSNSSAAGIGAGSSSSHCGNITITGGTITAKGGGGSANIGACPGGNCGNITITGGNIIALSAGSAVVGIGSGSGGSCGDISISGGDIMASGQSTGIGNSSSSSCGDISISGGDIMASGDAVGIGCAVSVGSVSNISITGGTVNARGTNTNYGCGIGIGMYGSLGTITIGGTTTQVTATKGSSAHNSIGRGNAAETTCGTITIGGTVYPDGISASPYTYPEP